MPLPRGRRFRLHGHPGLRPAAHPRQTVGGAADYLLEEQTATVAFNDGNPLYVELPASVELTVSQTDPGVQGDRSTGGTKPATLETGAQISVPLFITTGEKVKVDTRTGDYMGRAARPLPLVTWSPVTWPADDAMRFRARP